MMPSIVPLGLLALSAVCTSAHVQRTAVPDMLMGRQVDSTTGSATQTNAQAGASSASSTTSSDKDQHVYEGNLPVLCVEGCSDSLKSYGDCLVNKTLEACTPFCAETNYNALVTCLECSIANGQDDLSLESAMSQLDVYNSMCETASVNGFQPTTTLTATPTTRRVLSASEHRETAWLMHSGPFSTSTTGNLTLATWTGFTSYLDQLTATGINTESWPTTSASSTSSSGAASKKFEPASMMAAALSALMGLLWW